MPKLAAAIITGTMASPSRPSVRFTALPAPTMMNVAEQDEEPAEIEHQSLKNGNTSEVIENGTWPSLTSTKQAMAAIDEFDARAACARQSRRAICFVTFR